jgi:hypothetical protein
MILAVFGMLQINEGIPDEARHSPFETGQWITACRFSNGQPVTLKDQAPDVRGIAIKLFVRDQETDLLATNEGGRSHARDAAQFLDVSDILATKIGRGVLGGLKVAAEDLIGGKLEPREAARIATILVEETALHRVESLATEAYWGSVVELAGRPIKYSLQPHVTTTPGTDADREDPNFLRKDMLALLSRGPVRFDLCIQFFRDDHKTPVDDASVKWDAPLVKIGGLQLSSSPGLEDEENINNMAFNPGNGFVPLGITRDRKEIYAASARNRGALSSEKVRLLFNAKSTAAGVKGTS